MGAQISGLTSWILQKEDLRAEGTTTHVPEGCMLEDKSYRDRVVPSSIAKSLEVSKRKAFLLAYPDPICQY